MESGRTLWEELCYRYYEGVDYVKAMKRKWASLQKNIDQDMYSHVQEKLATQEKDATIWRDTCLKYFQKFSKMPIPENN
jgi:alpha-glucuronidase